MNDLSLTLRDLGERQIVRGLLASRYGGGATPFGDDCATLPDIPEGAIVVASTDPCPPPMAYALGFEDEYYRGWLVATINLSDLAAAGATPAGLLSSLILPAAMQVSSFERLLDGIDACCAQVGTASVGGNLKEGRDVDVAATAVGYVEEGRPLSRSGARAGDLVVCLGELGSFWAGSLMVRQGLGLEDGHPLLNNVLTPLPKVAVGAALRGDGLLRCAIDNSDGLQPSLAQLAEASGVGISLQLDSWEFSPGVRDAAEALGTLPHRLALGWGDWQLVGSCATDRLSKVELVAAREEVEVHVVGEVVEGTGVSARFDGREGPLMRLESERFVTSSWFSVGLDGYIEQMLQTPLLESTAT
jgi:thiamine-monophosphate kinase